MDCYRVNPGSKVNLAKLSPKDTSLFPKLTKENHLHVLEELREHLKVLQHLLFAANGHKLLVVVQAMDTGGKDGLARHVFAHLDPQGVDVIPFKAPTAEELGHDFLWRIHRHCPGSGRITVFNRSHYEDIVAVRVKKIFPDPVWKRRYQHVIDFERMLVEEGTTVVKIFLHISKEEQKRRLESRLANPQKHWKFNSDDLKDRARFGEFLDAYSHVIEATSTSHAPWHIIPADRKWYRNVVVAKLIVDTLRGMKLSYPKPDFDPATIVISD
jgi:PPK2 family polyphosphate:nucleotide phosphotransferase